MGRGHDAAPVVAVAQPEVVAQFVERFLEQAVAEFGLVGGVAIELLAEPVGGDQGAGAAQLGFAEDKREDRDEKIVRADAERGLGQGRENPRRVVLGPLRRPGKARVEGHRLDEAGNAQDARETCGQRVEAFERLRADGQDAEGHAGVELRGGGRSRRLYLRILL